MRKLATALRDGSAGFTLIEVVVAMTVLFGALASLAYVGTFALADVGVSREREAATGLVNQALEQVRALPYDTVAKGLSSADLSAGGDANVTSSGGSYYFNGEQIPMASNTTIAPLVPHQSSTTVGGKPYTLSTYVTYYGGSSTSGAFRVTAIATWSSGLRNGLSQKKVSAQTVVYSGAGTSCGSTATHPYAAPCQSFFYGSSNSAPGGITFTPGTSGNLFGGVGIDTASLAVANRTSNMSIEQTWSVDSNLTLPGISYRMSTDDSDTVLGESIASASSDNDTSSGSRSEYVSQPTGTQAAQTHTFSSGGNSLRFDAASGPSGSATSTMSASASNACANAASPSTNQLTNLPCGNANTSNGTLSATLTIGANSALLAQVTPASGSAAHVARATSANSASSCTATTGGDGCVSASHRRSIGSVSLAGIPAISGITIPSGFDYLVKASSLNTTVAAEAGIGSTQTAPTRTGTVQYWNGTNYTSISLAAGTAQSFSPAPISLVSGSTSVTITASNFHTGATTAATCAAPCASATSTADSVLVGDITYTIVIGGVTVIDTTIHVDFGTLTASAMYKAAS